MRRGHRHVEPLFTSGETHQVRLGHHAHQRPLAIDHRRPADVFGSEFARELPSVHVGRDRHHLGLHDIEYDDHLVLLWLGCGSWEGCFATVRKMPRVPPVVQRGAASERKLLPAGARLLVSRAAGPAGATGAPPSPRPLRHPILSGMTSQAPPRRHLGLLGATGIGVGAIVGGGILALAGVAFSTTGPSAILAFALNGAIAMMTVVSFSELAARFPRSGGTYAYARRVLTVEAAFAVGWVVWFASVVAAVLYAMGFAVFLVPFLERLLQLAGGEVPAWIGQRLALVAYALAAAGLLRVASDAVGVGGKAVGDGGEGGRIRRADPGGVPRAGLRGTRAR